MASFYAELTVEGTTYPVRECHYAFTQATDEQGRAAAKVRHEQVYLTLHVPANGALAAWAAQSYKPLSGQVVFYDSQSKTALETLSWDEGHAVGYREQFQSGDEAGGAYLCQLTIAAPRLNWQPGGPTNYASPQLALLNPPPLLVPPLAAAAEQALPVVEEVAAAAGSALLAPLALTAGLILGTATPTSATDTLPKLPMVTQDEARLLYLEAQRELRALTPPEERELIDLLAKVRGVYVSGPKDLAYLYSQDIAFNKQWDQHAPADLRQLDLQATLQHVEYRDMSVPRKKGIGGAHNLVEWSRHHADYVEISRTPHPTVPGVEQVEYQIPALDIKGKPTGSLVNEVFEKTVYDPAIWPRPRLERALREALSDAYQTNGGSLPIGYWEGVTSQGDSICGFYRNNQVQTFFFK